LPPKFAANSILSVSRFSLLNDTGVGEILTRITNEGTLFVRGGVWSPGNTPPEKEGCHGDGKTLEGQIYT
jgi:hypothetical protein